MRIDRSFQFFKISNNLTFRKNCRKVACSRVHQLTAFPVACRYKKQFGATETLAETLRYHMSPQCLHHSSPPCHAVPRGNTFHFSGAFIFSRRSHGVRSARPSVCGGGGEDKKLESSEAAVEGDALFEAHTDLLSARSPREAQSNRRERGDSNLWTVNVN